MYAFLLTALVLITSADAACKARSEQYSTSQTILSKETVLIVEFELSCSGSHSEKDVWYANLNGRILPVVHHPKTKKFQVSYSNGHTSVSKGTYSFQFFNEATIGEIRKAIRNGEEISADPAFVIDVHHTGAQEQFWLATHFIASVAALLLWWFAYTTKVKLQS